MAMNMKMNMMNPITRSVLLAVVALGLPACGPSVPANPTWVADIRPLLVARCIRCHNAQGGIDPLTAKLVTWGAVAPIPAAYNFDFPTITTPLNTQLNFLKMFGPKSVRGEYPPGLPPKRMPPPPAENLQDWEIELLDNWANNPR